MVGVLVSLVKVSGTEFVGHNKFGRMSFIIRTEVSGSRKSWCICFMECCSVVVGSICLPLESDDWRGLMIFELASSFSCSVVMPRWLQFLSIGRMKVEWYAKNASMMRLW